MEFEFWCWWRFHSFIAASLFFPLYLSPVAESRIARNLILQQLPTDAASFFFPLYLSPVAESRIARNLILQQLPTDSLTSYSLVIPLQISTIQESTDKGQLHVICTIVICII